MRKKMMTLCVLLASLILLLPSTALAQEETTESLCLAVTGAKPDSGWDGASIVAALLRGDATLAFASDCAVSASGRLQADEPLSDEEAIECMSAGINLAIGAALSGEPEPEGHAFDIVEERAEEYMLEMGGDDEEALEALTPDEQLDLILRVARKFGRDADVAVACRTVVLPALVGIN